VPLLATNDRADGNATHGVGLGIKEQLSVNNAIGIRPREIAHGKRIEIGARAQYICCCVIQVQKGLQIGKVISVPEGCYRRKWKGYAISLGQRKGQFGLERAFDVKM
jgi:hypothetical protein